ncbi:unnamed protein product, partial [Prorocentrum cordatum]
RRGRDIGLRIEPPRRCIGDAARPIEPIHSDPSRETSKFAPPNFKAGPAPQSHRQGSGRLAPSNRCTGLQAGARAWTHGNRAYFGGPPLCWPRPGRGRWSGLPGCAFRSGQRGRSSKRATSPGGGPEKTDSAGRGGGRQRRGGGKEEEEEEEDEEKEKEEEGEETKNEEHRARPRPGILAAAPDARERARAAGARQMPAHGNARAPRPQGGHRLLKMGRPARGSKPGAPVPAPQRARPLGCGVAAGEKAQRGGGERRRSGSRDDEGRKSTHRPH